MTWLFLRFYLGVVIILIAAWQIQSYVFQTRSAEKNRRVVEEALGGGARLARDELLATPEPDRAATFQAIQDQFDYPMRVVPIDQRPMPQQLSERLAHGHPVLLYGSLIEIQFPDSDKLLEFGPLPQFVGPSQTEVTLGYGAVFALAALAIAILLRPLASQLRDVERAATAISQGNLAARVQSHRLRASLPLANAFNAMADRTESTLRAQRELLQAVSHELRTPLARIQFATDLIRTSKTPEEREKRLTAVDDATSDLDALVGELMAYVRLESHSPEGPKESVDLNALIEELIEIHAGLHPEVEFLHTHQDETVLLQASRSGLSRAVGNLLGNAARYARNRVSVSARLDDQHITIEVDDDGPGIPVKDRERVFEPFVRLDQNEGSGTGIGLALVQRIAARQGGSTRVTENSEGGARFQITLPATVAATETPMR